MTIDFQVRAELRDLLQHGSRNIDLREVRTRTRDSLAQLLLIFSKRLTKRFPISIVTFATLDDIDSILKVVLCFDLNVQAKPIQQLWPELTLFRISRSDQNKTRGMFDRDALALDLVPSRDRYVQQEIDQMVLEQVYLVNIKKAPVRARQ